MKKGNIFFIVWVCWAWKWTLIKNLQDSWEDFKFTISCRTRAPRDWEIEWVHSYFLTENEFNKKIENWEFIEYAINHWTSYYWTLKKEVIDYWINLWKNVIKELEWKWLKIVLDENPDLKDNVISIFLDIPNEEIKNRVESRGETMTEEDYKNRIASTELERWFSDIYNYTIDAHKNWPEEVLEEVLEIIKKHS